MADPLLGNTRQAKKMQLPLVFTAIERYEKRYGFVHVLSDVLKLTMSIDRCTRNLAWNNPRNCGVVYSIGEKLINQLAIS